jgi:LuxR family glucitol operon transcriptional activator
MVQVQDKLVDNLSDISPDPRWRKLVRSFRSDAQFQAAFEKALEKAVQRFAAEYSDQELVDALTQSTRFWDLPSVQKALKTIVTNPSSYLDKERDTLLDSFAEVAPGLEPERVEPAARFFLYCLAEEVVNIPQLFPLYQVQLQKASVEQARQLVVAVRELQFDQKQTMTALLEAVNQNQLLLAAPNQPVAAPAGPKIYHNLPRPDYSVFIGRESEKVKVIERLSPKKQGGVITIDGIGGVGKSALALEVAYYFLDNAPSLPENERFEAIVWTSAKQTVLTADGIRTRPQVLRNLEDIYTAISITLDRESILRARPEEQAVLVMDALAERRTLLIVDNLETVDDENLLEFLRELPLTAKAIVTTRHRIDVAYPVRLVGMPEADALALIANESEQKEVTLTPEEAKKLFQRTGGLPLAIVWSMGLMGMGHSVEAVLARLGAAKSDIIKFSFQSSVETIRDQDAFKVLLALSLFARDATREALGYVADFGEDEMSRDDALVALEKLSLVNKSGNRFSLLPLAKIFASAELDKNGELKNELTEKWITFFVSTFKTEGVPYGRYYAFDVEVPNILGFLEWCAANSKIEPFITLVLQSRGLFWSRGYWSEFWRYLELAYNFLITREANKEVIGKIVREQALITFFRGELESAEKLFLQALAIFEEMKDYVHIRRIYRTLVELHTTAGNLEQARMDLDKAYQAANLTGNSPDDIFKLKRYHAPVEIAAGNFDLAVKLLQESIEHQEKDDSPEESSALTGAHALIGKVEITRGNYTIAQSELNRAAELANNTQVKQDIAFVAQCFALLHEATHKKEDALKKAFEALNLFKQLGMKLKIVETEEMIARIQSMPE